MTDTRPSEAEVTVVVADDQATVRDALAAMLDLSPGVTVVGTAADGIEAVDLVLSLRPAVLLTDLRMPNLDGVGATERVVAAAPATAVILLTTYDDEESILRGLHAGARGYLTKNAGRAEIAAAISAAAAGQSVLDPAVQQRLLASITATPAPAQAAGTPPVDLTPRETEVLQLIAEGLANRDIAARLFVSESTVKTHINNLFAKAHLRDRAHAVRYAFDTGIAASRQGD
ncbi:response regulator transcription factor [Tsukamurella paurometabola]|uniref:Two component transcriptional regulator, LuxR family n=1 Tax=Tsukamurella paurometabola (strain ATCC 8368 / DSM 20162 / CCUG 35730 / CIP 100753 / JCM 10117 / KCTC 9821 / NBRC 16120 / NCIMB 702349 / NCTC 13040) TaxID=521096 RepID=D5UNN3_TSUPD|nr:response regulator transcription factor [Tsukamurella paurometabola]ADG78601.1 two component transcriptional regulator, LuxR family [Tsukamurella paurometabola DSM 20162]SUP32372.1 Nitrogen regulation protein C [Tsukamurella paurometabola]